MSGTNHNGALVPFSYGNTAVRVVVIDGEPWFVLADLARVLEIADVSRLASRLDDGVRRTHPIADSLGRIQNPTIVSEAGMYEVVFRSDKPEAVAFRRWITGTVLPEIRRTGSFNAQPTLPQTREERFALALVDANQMIVERDETIKELTAPARSWQLLADAKGDFSVAEAAKILSRDPSITTGRDRLFEFMAEQKWIFRSKNARGGWEAYQTAVDTRRLVEKPAKPFLNSKTGTYELPAPTIRVTAKGIGKLHELMGGTEPIRFVVGEAS